MFLQTLCPSRNTPRSWSVTTARTSPRNCCISESPSQYSVGLVKSEFIADDCNTNQNNSVCVGGGGGGGGGR